MTTTFLLDSTIHRLEDLTNQEIFIVVYSDGDTIICNWSRFYNNSLPCVFGNHFIIEKPFNYADFTHCECEKWETDDLYAAVCELGHKIIWDLNNDMAYLANSDTPVTATVYKLDDGTHIFAPHGWNKKCCK